MKRTGGGIEAHIHRHGLPITVARDGRGEREMIVHQLAMAQLIEK
jgi:hypothetical protein